MAARQIIRGPLPFNLNYHRGAYSASGACGWHGRGGGHGGVGGVMADPSPLVGMDRGLGTICAEIVKIQTHVYVQAACPSLSA
jgi:hypothetical protein